MVTLDGPRLAVGSPCSINLLQPTFPKSNQHYNKDLNSFLAWVHSKLPQLRQDGGRHLLVCCYEFAGVLRGIGAAYPLRRKRPVPCRVPGYLLKGDAGCKFQA